MDMNCTQCRELMTGYLDGELTRPNVAAVESHLASCTTCSGQVQQLQSSAEQLQDGIQRLAAAAPSPTDLVSGLQARMAGRLPSPTTVPTPLPRLRPLPCTSGLFGVQTAGEFLVRFTRSLGMMVRAGRPLPRALALLAASGEAGEHATECEAVSRHVQEGHALSAALAQDPKVFPLYLREAVRAGEVSGQLAGVLERLGLVLERKQEARQRIIANLSYPAVVLALTLGLVQTLSTTVLPRFTKIYAQHGKPLPWLSDIYFHTVGPFLSHPMWCLGLLGCLWLVHRVISPLGPWQDAMDSVRLRLPVVRAIQGQYLLSWCSSLAAVLIGGGVPVPRALGLVAAASGNRLYGRLLEDVQRQVETGIPLREALTGSPAFPTDARQMLIAGDEANCLEEAFESVSRLYHERLAAELKMMSAVIEPLSILLLGALVATFCFIVYGPIIQMAQVVTR